MEALTGIAYLDDILTRPEEIETWLMMFSEEALKLQRPLADGTLKIVARRREGRWRIQLEARIG